MRRIVLHTPFVVGIAHAGQVDVVAVDDVEIVAVVTAAAADVVFGEVDLADDIVAAARLLAAIKVSMVMML